jgi:hypothetical protein
MRGIDKCKTKNDITGKRERRKLKDSLWRKSVKNLVVKKKCRIKRVKIKTKNLSEFSPKCKNLGYKSMILILRKKINDNLKSLRKIKWRNNERKIKRKTTENLRSIISEYYKSNLRNKWKHMWNNYLIFKDLYKHKNKHSMMKYKRVGIMKLNNETIF